MEQIKKQHEPDVNGDCPKCGMLAVVGDGQFCPALEAGEESGRKTVDTIKMRNRAMARSINKGKCIDLSGCERTQRGDYILEEFTEGVDYCDAEREAWIWSIGKHKTTGQIIASVEMDLYQNPDYECVWLR